MRKLSPTRGRALHLRQHAGAGKRSRQSSLRNLSSQKQNKLGTRGPFSADRFPLESSGANKFSIMRLFTTSLTLFFLPALISAQTPPIRFREVGMEAGLTKVPFSSMKQHYVVETISGGVALFDCDNDGKLDILVVNDATIEQAKSG